jgi:hypothetical protein
VSTPDHLFPTTRCTVPTLDYPFPTNHCTLAMFPCSSIVH